MEYETVEKEVTIDVCDDCGAKTDETASVLGKDYCESCLQTEFPDIPEDIDSIDDGITRLAVTTVEKPVVSFQGLPGFFDDDDSRITNLLFATFFFPVLWPGSAFLALSSPPPKDQTDAKLFGFAYSFIPTLIWLTVILAYAVVFI